MGVPRERARWRTPFGRLVKGESIPRLIENLLAHPTARAHGLTLSASTVHDWVAGRYAPSLDFQDILLKVYPDRLTVRDLRRQRWKRWRIR